MVDCIIKICGINSPAIAKMAAIAGANYIGLVFHPDSPRYIHPADAREISRAAREHGATPVAIFVNHHADAMQNICKIAEINTVQLHGDNSRREHHLLPDDYQRIMVQSINENGELQNDIELNSLFPERDFILIDHCNPGSGKTFSWKDFKYDLSFPWLLAGGLTNSNVKNAINLLQPNGVDVSSGVEMERGKKDMELIKKFINTVRERQS